MNLKTSSNILTLISGMENRSHTRKSMHDIMREGGYFTYSQMYSIIKYSLELGLIKRRKHKAFGRYRLTERGRDLSSITDLFKFDEAIR